MSDTYGWLALAFGILGIIGSFLLVGLVTGPLGIILGIIGIKRDDEIPRAIWGIVCSIIGIIMSIGFFYMWYTFVWS